VMEDPEFRRGDIEIQWLERRLDSLVHAAAPPDGLQLAALAGALLAHAERRAPAGAGNVAARGATPSAWQRAGRLDSLR